MLSQLKTHDRFKETLFLGTLALLCFAFSIFRFIHTDTRVFLFLNWNLFLAFLPWLFSTLLIIYPGLQRSGLILTASILCWLLFFPNALYILTDLFHLRLKTSMPIWFDLVMILSFAWVGLVFGFMSLWDIEKILSRRISRKLMPLISSVLLFLGSFGIYLGRYLRWNSWDVIREPSGLYNDVSDRFMNPVHYPRTWGMTFFMFIFLSMIYWSFRIIKNRR